MKSIPLKEAREWVQRGVMVQRFVVPEDRWSVGDVYCPRAEELLWRVCPGEKIKTNITVNSEKDANWDKAEELGLKDDAARNFAYTAMELKLTLEVDIETGNAQIVAIDDVELARPIKA